MDLNKLQNTVLNTCQVNPEKPLVVGVSGGTDSLCLIHSLADLGLPVTAVHFDHQIRQESGQDAEYVKQLMNEWHIPFLLGSLDVNNLAAKEKLSIEEAARKARYRFMFQTARRIGAQAVVVGHTADDQVETVLMHFLRGAGSAGLRGMAYSSVVPEWDIHIPVIRPLLWVWREETEQYCRDHGLVPIQDPSNANQTFFRNRLRHSLLPELQTYNPMIKQGIWRSSQSLAGDYEILELEALRLWAVCEGQVKKGQVAFLKAKTGELTRGQINLLIRTAIRHLRPYLRDIDYDSVQRAARFIAAPSRSHRMELVDHLSIQLDREWIVLSDDRIPFMDESWPQITPNVEIMIRGESVFSIGQGWECTCRIIPQSGGEEIIQIARGDPFHAVLDADQAPFPLLLRTRLAGDTFTPFGMEGRQMRLSDFWINQRLPLAARKGWPLVFAENQMIWIPGFRISHKVRVTPSTQRVLSLKITSIPDTFNPR
jgi:tRNA(Ile)-lysidine synthase